MIEIKKERPTKKVLYDLNYNTKDNICQRLPGTIATFEARRLSNETVDRKKRYNQILEILEGCYPLPLTARNIAKTMFNLGYTPIFDPNFARPRITELMYKGMIEQVGTTRDVHTGKTVTLFKLWKGAEVQNE